MAVYELEEASKNGRYELGERRVLLLNLRKGYFKVGELFGTKVYLSQIQALKLRSEREGRVKRGSQDLKQYLHRPIIIIVQTNLDFPI